MKTNDTLPANAEIDRMLSAFFKSEMPASFPPLKLPARSELPMPATTMEYTHGRRSATTRAKLSIAASVALLIGGGWYLSSQMSDKPTDSAKIGKGTDNAKMPKELKKAMP